MKREERRNGGMRKKQNEWKEKREAHRKVWKGRKEDRDENTLSFHSFL